MLKKSLFPNAYNLFYIQLDQVSPKLGSKGGIFIIDKNPVQFNSSKKIQKAFVLVSPSFMKVLKLNLNFSYTNGFRTCLYFFKLFFI